MRRLTAAVTERDRSADRYDASVGTAEELTADVARHAADEQVGARTAWLRWVEDEGYRGLNSGPFDLRRELEDALGPVA